MKKYPKLSEISQLKRNHLAYRLDWHTGTGLLTACRIARIELGDLPINEVFVNAGMTDHQAKVHATKVLNFKSIVQ